MPPPRIGSNEILRTIVGILAVVNIACFLYYFVVHRPAADVVLQTQLAHVARVKDAASHTHVNDSLSHAARDWDVEDAAVARDPAVGVAYYQSHGLDHAHLGVSGAPWWSIRRAHSSGDEDVMAVASPRLGAVPFAGPLWLPWLGERNVTNPPEGASLLPHRIPRDAVATALHLVLPPSVMIAATLNGTTPLHYNTHFRHPPKRLGGALHEEEAARWFQEEIIDGSPDANQTYLERKLVPKKRLVEILTALYHMIDQL